MRRLNNKGVNLIELVATLVVVGIAIPVLFSMWANISWRSVGSENVAEATSYARELMEEIRSKRFDENIASPWTSSLGADPGETRSDARTFDDLDDYVNATDPSITTPAAGYSRSASIEYVYLGNNNTWQACSLPWICVSSNNCTSCNACCYKRITVNIRRNDEMPANLNLTTIVAGN